MRLYDLAPELLAQILRFTDPSTFYILTQSVSPFLTGATASSKSLLLYQLGALPGLKHGLEDLTIQELLYCFQERAAKNLCGIDVLADITLFKFGFSDFDIRQSMFYPQFNGADSLFMVHRGEPCVSIFKLCLRGGPPTFNMVVDLRKEYELEESCKMTILRIAASSSGWRWAILYSYETVMPEIPTAFVKERFEGRDMQATSRQSFKLAIIDQEGDMYHLTLDNRRPGVFDRYQLAGLAITDDEHVAICWRFTSLEMVCNEVIAYRGRTDTRFSIRKFRERFQEGLCELPAKLTYSSGNISKIYLEQVPIHDIKFSSDGSQLLFFDPTSPIHYMYRDYSEEEDEPIELNCIFVGGFSLGEDAEDEKNMHIGMPFYTSHTTQEENNGNWLESVCTDVWLSIGTEENAFAEDAYIVRSNRSQPFINCDCVPDLDFGRRQYGWDALVKLKGFLRSSSSLGPVVAISGDSRRLAVADWKDIRIWPLDPQGLIQNEREHYLRTNRQSDFEMSSGIGSIEPFELPTNGDVIHKLYFAGGDFLYAVTDHGMTMWNLSHHSGGISTSEPPLRENVEYAPRV